MNFEQEKPGSLLVDVVLSIGLFGMVISAFSSGIFAGQQGAMRSSERIRALYLAEEGLEAVRSIRNNGTEGYLDIRNPAGQFLQLSANGWELGTTPNTIDGLFTRTITVTQISPNVQRISSNVEWLEEPNSRDMSVSLETYMTNYMSEPEPNWEVPFVAGSGDLIIGSSFEKVALHGDYALIADSSSTDATGTGIVVYDISDITDPILVNVIHMTGAYDIDTYGNYAYVVTHDTDEDLMILNITNPATATCCQQNYDIIGTEEANVVQIAAGTGLFIGTDAGSDNEIEVFDIGEYPSKFQHIGSIDESITDISGIDAIEVGNEVYIYVAGKYGSTELSVFRLSDGTRTGGAEGGGGNNPGNMVAIHNTGAYLGPKGNPTACELFSYDISGSKISDPNVAPSCGGNYSYDLAGDDDGAEAIFDMAVGGDGELLFMATNTERGGVRYHLQIIDISNVHNVNSAYKEVYDDDLLANWYADKGIDFRESDDTVVMVGGSAGSPGSYFFILRPAS